MRSSIPEVGGHRPRLHGVVLDRRSESGRVSMPLLAGLLAVLFVGGFLRFYRLTDVPPGFFRDEADKGYTAYSLLKTGRDLEGSVWPLQIRSLRVYTSPIYQWASIPGIAVFGLSEWTTRFPAAFVGTLTILVVFPLGCLLFGKTGGLFASLFLALSPWHILFSRWANQGILVPFLAALSISLLLDSARRKEISGPWKDLEAFGAGLVGFLAFFSYAPARLFIPLFLAVVGVLLFQRNRRATIFALVGFAIPAAPFAIYLVSHWGETGARFQAISLLSGDRGALEKTGAFCLNYLKHLSPGFLFLHGDANLRHSVPGWGLLFPVDAVTLLAGIVVLGRRGDWRTRIPLIGFFLAFVPASLTVEGVPHALRSIGALPWAQLICVAGLLEILRIVSPLTKSGVAGRAPVILIIGAIVFSSIRFNAEFFTLYPRESYPYWEYGYREAMEALRKLRKPTDEVTVTRYSEYPEAFFLFYWRVDPKEFQREQSLPGVNIPHWKEEPDGSRHESTLVLAYARETVAGEEIWRLDGPDGRPLWRIVRVPR